jgi:hypothetical protein
MALLWCLGTGWSCFVFLPSFFLLEMCRLFRVSAVLVTAVLLLFLSLLLPRLLFCSVRFRSHGFRLSVRWFEALTHSGFNLGAELASPVGVG